MAATGIERSPPTPRLRRAKAEEEGFEPPRASRPCRFSRPVPSTARPLLRIDQRYPRPMSCKGKNPVEKAALFAFEKLSVQRRHASSWFPATGRFSMLSSRSLDCQNFNINDCVLLEFNFEWIPFHMIRQNYFLITRMEVRKN